MVCFSLEAGTWNRLILCTGGSLVALLRNRRNPSEAAPAKNVFEIALGSCGGMPAMMLAGCPSTVGKQLSVFAMTKGAGLATLASGIARLDSLPFCALGHGCLFLISFRPAFILLHRHISLEACSFLLAVEKPRVRACLICKAPSPQLLGGFFFDWRELEGGQNSGLKLRQIKDVTHELQQVCVLQCPH